MANFNGLVKFNDGTIMHLKFNACSDIFIPKLRKSFEEVAKHWDNNDFDIPDDCNHDSEEVDVFEGGCHWKAEACRKCGYLIEKYSVERLNFDEQIWEIPKWVEDYCKEKGFEFYK